MVHHLSLYSFFIPAFSLRNIELYTLKKIIYFFLILRRLHNDSRNKYNTAVHIKKPSFQDILLLRFLFCAHFVALFIVGVSKFSGAWKSIQDFFFIISTFILFSLELCWVFFILLISVKYCLMFMRKLCRVILTGTYKIGYFFLWNLEWKLRWI